jgi:hypothetical protein
MPRWSRIGFVKADGTLVNINVNTSDNCSDSGAIPGQGTIYSYDFTTPTNVSDFYLYSVYPGGDRACYIDIQASTDNSTWVTINGSLIAQSYANCGLRFTPILTDGYGDPGTQSNGVGSNASYTSGERGGNGGQGITYSISGTAVTYGGGGGGGAGCSNSNSTPYGIGGAGGGGNGQLPTGPRSSSQGVDGLGGGGGAGGDGLGGANNVQFGSHRGGHGVVIIRYLA